MKNNSQAFTLCFDSISFRQKYFAVRLIDPTSNLQQQQHQGNDKLTDEYHFLSSSF